MLAIISEKGDCPALVAGSVCVSGKLWPVPLGLLPVGVGVEGGVG